MGDSVIEAEEYEFSSDHIDINTDHSDGSIQEISNFEHSFNSVSQNNAFGDIFSFRDDTPPPIRAPTICDEDLYEYSSEQSNSISKEISLISSDLHTSGSSTDSQPFGYMHFTEPLMTSTPKKSKSQWSLKLQKKKTSKATLKKATAEQCECPKRCTSKTFYSKEMIEECHYALWSLNPKDRKHWFKKNFEDFQGLRRGQFVFKLRDHSVCLRSWLIAHGLSKSIFYRQRRIWMKKEVPSHRQASLAEKKMEALNWFGEYVASRGENPPHVQEIWLPFGLRKNEIYEAYKMEMDLDEKESVSHQTFLNIWNDHYSHVRIKQSNLFTRCTTCDKLDRELHKQLNPEKNRNILTKKQDHLHRQMKEKTAYYRRKVVSRRRPDKYLSLIIDGMDQSKTNIPHFKGRQSKEFAATRQLNVHVTGVLSHSRNKKILYTDFHQYKHDSNLTLNILLKVLWNHSKGKPLPPVLYLQADNCFRENKNKYVLSFLELLVRKRIFYEVQLSFLHVGHTHEDIDQMFSVIADHLRHKDAATLPVLNNILYDAEELGGCFDISGWLSPHLRGVKHHTRTNTFRYRLNEENGDVNIYYRKNVDHSWKALDGSFFNQNPDGTTSMPTRQPAVLNASFEKIDIPVLRKNMKIWSNMMSTEDIAWWENFLKSLEEKSKSPRNYSRTGAVWCLSKIPKYAEESLENSEDLSAVPEHLQRILREEEENPDVHFN
ncbi:uncharacterized protein LOC134271502 [Saccostrea cucullata]|uniref:uncharacterized protein LOC134271502 n=1 Tax=Saccostrea cuccullata TaxID=36930 RepID=UPI002ED3163F